MTESEIKHWNDAGGYYDLKREKKCMLCGIAGLLAAILWLPVLFTYLMFLWSTWGWSGPASLWWGIIFYAVLFFPGIFSIGIFIYIRFGLLRHIKIRTKKEREGFALSLGGMVFHLLIWGLVLVVALRW